MNNRTIPATVAIVALSLPIGGCFQHTYTIGKGGAHGEQVYKNWHHHWLFGLIRPKHQKTLDVAKLCPSGNATIHERVSFVNGLIDVLVGIVYSPTTVTILCDDGSRAELELDEQQVSQIVTDPRFLILVEELAPLRLAEARTALAQDRWIARRMAAGDGAGSVGD